MQLLAVFLCGVLFALGLGVAGMTQPAKIIAFLDITGDWDPSLAFVMAGAVAVNFVLYRASMRRARPVFGEKFVIPSHRDINARLIAGAGLFGIGWGLSGYCPGPAWVSSVTGRSSVLAFVIAMLAGMLLFQWLQKEEPRPATGAAAGNVADEAERSCG
jgi:uncharacterized membrane protein YedE/YeeE